MRRRKRIPRKRLETFGRRMWRGQETSHNGLRDVELPAGDQNFKSVRDCTPRLAIVDRLAVKRVDGFFIDRGKIGWTDAIAAAPNERLIDNLLVLRSVAAGYCHSLGGVKEIHAGIGVERQFIEIASNQLIETLGQLAVVVDLPGLEGHQNIRCAGR